MARTRSEELGLATALASTTDKGRAEILASMEGEGSQPTKPAAKKPAETSVKKELAVREDMHQIDEAWGKVSAAVSAAQSACRKSKETSPDEDPQACFQSHLEELLAVLKEMTPKDFFKGMAEEAVKSRM